MRRQIMSYTDETIVAAAFIMAIRRRRTTAILTRDQDILDQLYKMQWLLDTHCRGMFCRGISSLFVGERQCKHAVNSAMKQCICTGTHRLIARSDPNLDSARTTEAQRRSQEGGADAEARQRGKAAKPAAHSNPKLNAHHITSQPCS
jgi:hypothetical protein